LCVRRGNALPRTRGHRRPGVALLATLALLAMLGLLMVGAMAVAVNGQHAARLSMTDGILIGAADYAVGQVLGDGSALGLADLPLNRATSFPTTVPGIEAIEASASVTRLPSGVYWFVGQARTRDADSARRAVNVLARTVWIGAPPAAPFVARGSTVLAADVTVLPETGDEPDCAAASVPPPIETADSMALFEAPEAWVLTPAAGVRVVPRDTVITSGALEGILMVDGDLTIDGAFDMRGLIVARGRVRSSIGLRLTGAIVSQAAGPGAIDLRGAAVRFTPCLVGQIVRRLSSIEIVRGWGWTELF
jgi:hypothetical protein